MSKSRIAYMDYLRALSILGIIVIHVVSPVVSEYSNSYEWWIGNIFDSLFRWSVPMFFLISGNFILSKEITNIKSFYSKMFKKIVIPYLLWSVIYFVLLSIRGTYDTGYYLGQFSFLFLNGEIFNRLWFFNSIIGLYVIAPFLSVLLNNISRKHLKLFLILIFSYIFIYDFLLEFFSINLSIDLNYIYGYIGYFILGHWLRKKDINLKLNYVLILLVSSFVFTAVGTYFMSAPGQEFNGYFYSYLSPNVFISVVCIYVLARNFLNKGISIVENIGKNSLGIYLIHSLTLIFFSIFGLDALRINPLISVPIISMATLLVSFSISLIIKKIPVVKMFLP